MLGKVADSDGLGMPRRGLDLHHLHAALRAAHRVGAALHAKRHAADREIPRDRLFGPPALAQHALQLLMPPRSLVHPIQLARGRNQIALLQRELRQRADVDRMNFRHEFSSPRLTAPALNGTV